jgi:hypothetical protein
MKIDKAIEVLAEIENSSASKRTLKSLKEFKQLLNGLLAKNLPLQSVTSIEEKLDSMPLGENDRIKKSTWAKEVASFVKFLSDEFNIIPEGHYTSLGLALGAGLGSSVGTVFGVVSDNIGLSISMGICFGLVFGITIGKYLDDKALKEDRVILFK